MFLLSWLDHKMSHPPAREAAMARHKRRKHTRLERILLYLADKKKAPPPENLLDKERSPPPRPLPLEFPQYAPPKGASPLSAQHMSSLKRQLVSFRKPSDATDAFFAHFNIDYQTNVPLSSFIPSGHFDTGPFLYDSDLKSMLTELSFANEDAFREILRMPPLEGHTKPRLAYSRNFFASLEDMSRYWDTSDDNYYHVEIGGEKKDNDGDTVMEDANPKGNGSAVPSPGYDFMTEPFIDDTLSTSESDAADAPSVPKKEVYKGYRLGNSAQTPPSTRSSVVRNLLKMIVYKFSCRDYEAGLRERLKIVDINVPQGMIMYNFCICGMPKDRELARGRYVEGPVMGASIRHEVVWREETRERLAKEGFEKGHLGDVVPEQFDFLREVGAMLVLALQRGREDKGKKEEYWKKETEDWWWAQKPRWGGGETKWGQLAYEQFEDDDPSWSPAERELQLDKRVKSEEAHRKLAALKNEETSVDALIADTGDDRERPPPKKKNRLTERLRRGSERAKNRRGEGEEVEMRDGRRLMFATPARRKWYEDWRQVKPNGCSWDDKVIYKKIGKEEGEWDDVFQVGCVNHHVCLVKMRVSKRYLRWIEKGDGEDDGEMESEDVVMVQRSRWFDLFGVEDRKEFLRGMWRVMCWVMRDEVPKTEYEKMEKSSKEEVGNT